MSLGQRAVPGTVDGAGSVLDQIRVDECIAGAVGVRRLLAETGVEDILAAVMFQSTRPEYASVSVAFGATWLTVPLGLSGTLYSAIICCATGTGAGDLRRRGNGRDARATQAREWWSARTSPK